MIDKRKSEGFTLIELSIVIVIIGLIVAGVVGGQTLVKQAKLRSIIAEQNQAKLALNAFKLEYDAVPGDFDNAVAYWGGATTNGNGNKRMQMVAINGAIEAYRAWQHLELAELFPGNFTPSNATAITSTDFSIKIPASKFTGAAITLVYDEEANDITAGDGATGAAVGRNVNANVVLFGGVQTVGNGNIANGTIFDAKDVQGLDDKVDDGSPDTGAVVAVGSAGGTAANCIDTTPNPDAYNLDGNDQICAVAFEL